MDNQYTTRELDEIVQLLRSVPDVPVPAQFDIQFKKSLRMEVAKKRKHTWRMVASVAAIFMVGFLSYMAQGSMDVLPHVNEINAPSVVSVEKEPKKEETATPAPVVTGSVESNKESTPPVQGNAKVKDPASQATVQKEQITKNQGTAGAVPERAATPRAMVMNAPTEGGLYFLQGDQRSDGAMQSMPIPLTEEEQKEVTLYIDLINEAFEGLDFTIKDYKKKNNDEWHFNIFIFSENNGTMEEKEILVIGQDGTIKKWENEL
ncbi:MAG: hypothetical protein RRY25_04080 [Anaerovorax sp.]